MSKCEKQCGNCIHYEICDPYVSPNESFPEVKGGCKCFKDKSLFVELPCKVGDKVYCANFITKEIKEFKVEYIELDKYASWFILDIENEYISKFSFERIGTLFFLDRAEAEAKLKEVQNG